MGGKKGEVKEWALNRVRKITDNRTRRSEPVWLKERESRRSNVASTPDLWLLRENGKIVGSLQHGNAPEIDSTVDHLSLPLSLPPSSPVLPLPTLSLFIFISLSVYPAIYPLRTSESKPDECLAVFRTHPNIDNVTAITYQQVLTRLFNSLRGIRGFAWHYSTFSTKIFYNNTNVID